MRIKKNNKVKQKTYSLKGLFSSSVFEIWTKTLLSHCIVFSSFSSAEEVNLAAACF